VLAAELPVIADADTGFGNALNVMHTVRNYESVGLSGLHMEDQVSPKKCGHFTGHALIPVDEMVGKIRAALDARRDPDFLIIARTDGRSVNGLDDAIARANAYAEAGADAVFVEAPKSPEEYAAIRRATGTITLVADVTEGGKSPALAAEKYYSLGFKIVFFSASASRAVMKTLEQLYGRLKTEHTTNGMLDAIIGFDERNRLMGLADVYELEKKYGK
jgi:2-methylisocitrate lyase-like PEP mutase family enzyme